MEVSVTGQTLVFLAACCFGAALGAFYDLFRIFRVAVPCSRAAVFVQDIIFWLFCAVASFLFLLYVNTGIVRLFVLLGELLGATLYYVTLGVLVMRSARAIIGFFRAVFRFLGRLIARPLRKLGRLCGRLANFITNKVKNLIKKQCKQMKGHLKVRAALVYNLGNRIKNKPEGAAAAARRRKKRRRRKKNNKRRKVKTA